MSWRSPGPIMGLYDGAVHFIFSPIKTIHQLCKAKPCMWRRFLRIIDISPIDFALSGLFILWITLIEAPHTRWRRIFVSAGFYCSVPRSFGRFVYCRTRRRRLVEQISLNWSGVKIGRTGSRLLDPASCRCARIYG